MEQQTDTTAVEKKQPTILQLRVYPDNILKQKARSFKIEALADEEYKDQIQYLINCMYDTMIVHEGIGLASNQVGFTDKLIVYHHNNENHYMIEPTITRKSNKQIESLEQCLSFPGIRVKLARAENITISFFDIEGKVHIETFEGDLAKCLQHEVDHLNGINFIDYLSRIKKDILTRKYKKMAKRSKR